MSFYGVVYSLVQKFDGEEGLLGVPGEWGKVDLLQLLVHPIPVCLVPNAGGGVGWRVDVPGGACR